MTRSHENHQIRGNASELTDLPAAPTYRPGAIDRVLYDVGELPTFGILGTFPPTVCGLATFSAALCGGLSTNGVDARVIRVTDGSTNTDSRVIGELVNGSTDSVSACSELLDQNDIVIIQHEYGIYGGVDGDEVVDILSALRVPSVVVAHTVLKCPTPHQRAVLEEIVSLADQVVVMSEAANDRLRTGYDVDPRKITTIPHGAAIPRHSQPIRSSRPTLLTWGLIGPGKGIERVIDAMACLRDLPGEPRYLIAGQTHPKVLATAGEAYRSARIEQARNSGVSSSVHFDAGYQTVASLNALAQSAVAVVLPYDSTDQVTSGVLVDAIASGRPVVATAFPHAVELLAGGAGIVVDHDDTEALVIALRRVLTEPNLAESMATEARRLAPQMAWSVVAGQYLRLAHRLVGERSALT